MHSSSYLIEYIPCSEARLCQETIGFASLYQSCCSNCSKECRNVTVPYSPFTCNHRKKLVLSALRVRQKWLTKTRITILAFCSNSGLKKCIGVSRVQHRRSVVVVLCARNSIWAACTIRTKIIAHHFHLKIPNFLLSEKAVNVFLELSAYDQLGTIVHFCAASSIHFFPRILTTRYE